LRQRQSLSLLTSRPGALSLPHMGTPPPEAVKRLVDRFEQDRKVFLSGDYKEEQGRAELPTSRC